MDSVTKLLLGNEADCKCSSISTFKHSSRNMPQRFFNFASEGTMFNISCESIYCWEFSCSNWFWVSLAWAAALMGPSDGGLRSICGPVSCSISPSQLCCMILFEQTSFHKYKKDCFLNRFKNEIIFYFSHIAEPMLIIVCVVTKLRSLAGRFCPRARQATLTRWGLLQQHHRTGCPLPISRLQQIEMALTLIELFRIYIYLVGSSS